METYVLDRMRFWAGTIGGVLLVALGAMHSLLGWPALRASFARTSAPAPLVQGLAVPWHLAGMSMVMAGVLAIVGCVRGARGRDTSRWPLLVVGGAYAVFGLAGLVLVGVDATFAMFVVPGVLLLYAGT